MSFSGISGWKWSIRISSVEIHAYQTKVLKKSIDIKFKTRQNSKCFSKKLLPTVINRISYIIYAKKSGWKFGVPCSLRNCQRRAVLSQLDAFTANRSQWVRSRASNRVDFAHRVAKRGPGGRRALLDFRPAVFSWRIAAKSAKRSYNFG